MMEKKIKIAVIDSGVCSTRSEFIKYHITHVETKLYKYNTDDNIGHGTAISYILCKAIDNVEIISIKMFDTDYITTESDIIEVLELIYSDYPDVDIIHISNGITYIHQYDRFYDICQRLCLKGKFIVSAYDNDGSISYPAAFENTIGVYWDKYVRSVKEFFFLENSRVEILGYAGNLRLPWGKEGYSCVSGSSFVAPYITARVAIYVSQYSSLTLEELRKLLAHDAKKKITLPLESKQDFQLDKISAIRTIKKAIIFPYNKETQALLANSDLVGFDIVGAYDYKYSVNLNKSTADILFGESVENTIIKNYEKINWEGTFDTIIVGHLNIVNCLTRNDYMMDILNNCCSYKKNCFLFDAIDYAKYGVQIDNIRNNGNFVISHHIEDLATMNFPSGSYHKISSPTLAIVGTSPRQGKYNVQLSLRRRFLEDGYDIGQVGTEPSGHLFGMNLVFSNGYESQYILRPDEEIVYLNEGIFNIGIKDIIIMGTQSNTIPMQFGNLGFLTYHQQNSLIALEPDCTILCINFDDDMHYIRRTISVIKNFYMSNIIGIVAYPFHRHLMWNINNVVESRISSVEEDYIKKKLYDEFAIQAYINGNSKDMDNLYNSCIEFFSTNE